MTIKNLILGLALITGLSAQAASNCDEHDIRAKVKASVNARVGNPAGGNDQILKIAKVYVITTKDDAGNIKALYSFE